MTNPRLNRLLLPALALALLLLPGCGDNNTAAPSAHRSGPTPGSPTGENPETSAEPDGLPPGRDNTGSTNGDPGEVSQTPAMRPGPSGNDPDPADGRVATFNGQPRLPFPEEGEGLTEHLAFTKLADHDAFHNPIDPADIPAVVPWEQAGQYVGHTITVQGRIVNIGQTRSGSVNFLNFHQDWRGKFYMVVFDDLAETLDGGVEGTFLNKLVRVRGLVEPHDGRPQIKIESMEQVEFVEE